MNWASLDPVSKLTRILFFFIIEASLIPLSRPVNKLVIP